MELNKIFTVEVVAMGVILFAVLLTGIIIVIKMRPLKNFDEVKFGNVLLKRGKEQDKREEEALAAYQKEASKINERLEAMVGEFKKINERLNIQYSFIREAAVAAYKSVLWGDKAPPFPEVIEGGLMLLMLGQNGNVVTRIRECIMGLKDIGINLYQSELNDFINARRDTLNSNIHFWSMIEEIRKGIY
jgi:hypothetical protein